MRGLITSQFNVIGASFAPVCAPIAFIRLDSAATDPAYGELSSSDRNYNKYLRILQETIQQSFVRVALPPMPGDLPTAVR